MRTTFILGFILLFMFLVSCKNEPTWKSLVESSGLDNWEIKTGSATYTNIEGVIIGTTKTGTPNTFLCTKEKYGDFILSYDVWVDPTINSGVQIRSEENDKGRVFGYQVELDPSERSYSGGIYDEGRRAWLYPMSRNDFARTAFKRGEWNHFRVEAMGNHLYTWVNDEPAAHIVDDLTKEGFIGFQVHSISSEEDAGKEVKWKNIKINTSNFDESSYIESHTADPISFLSNELADFEKADNWKMLWNGENFEGWEASEDWNVENGALKSTIDKSGNRATLKTKDSYTDFVLELEFSLEGSAQSSIFYKSLQDGLEYNLSNLKVNDKMMLSGLGSLIDPINLSIKDRGVQYKGDGNWNQLRIIVEGQEVEHWLNGEKMIDETIEHSFSAAPITILNNNSYLGLRSIKIKEL